MHCADSSKIWCGRTNCRYRSYGGFLLAFPTKFQGLVVAKRLIKSKKLGKSKMVRTCSGDLTAHVVQMRCPSCFWIDISLVLLLVTVMALSCPKTLHDGSVYGKMCYTCAFNFSTAVLVRASDIQFVNIYLHVLIKCSETTLLAICIFIFVFCGLSFLLVFIVMFLLAAFCAVHSASISVTQGEILRFCALQGWHVALMGMKFDMEELTKVWLLHAKFHPYRCRVGCWPPKLKILRNFGT